MLSYLDIDDWKQSILVFKNSYCKELEFTWCVCFFEWDITPKFSWSLFWLIVLVLINCHRISNLTGSNFSDLFLLGVTDDSKPALAKITPKIKPWMTKKVFYSTANNFLIISLTLFCLSVFVSNHHIATISWIKTLTLL